MNNNTTAKEAIAKTIQGINNGIIVEYHDHLSCDAFIVRVRKDGQDMPITEGNTELKVTMVGDSDYYGTKGLRSTVRDLLIEYKNKLPVYFLDLGWYTFLGKYQKVQDYWIEDRIIPASIEIGENELKVSKSMLHVDWQPEETEIVA